MVEFNNPNNLKLSNGKEIDLNNFDMKITKNDIDQKYLSLFNEIDGMNGELKDGVLDSKELSIFLENYVSNIATADDINDELNLEETEQLAQIFKTSTDIFNNFIVSLSDYFKTKKSDNNLPKAEFLFDPLPFVYSEFSFDLDNMKSIEINHIDRKFLDRDVKSMLNDIQNNTHFKKIKDNRGIVDVYNDEKLLGRIIPSGKDNATIEIVYDDKEQFYSGVAFDKSGKALYYYQTQKCDAKFNPTTRFYESHCEQWDSSGNAIFYSLKWNSDESEPIVDYSTPIKYIYSIYDEQKNPIEQQIVNIKDGTTTHYTKYNNEFKGRVTDKQGEYVHDIYFEYDENGNKIGYKIIDCNKIIQDIANGENIKNAISQIRPDNVLQILDKYKTQTGENLFDTIITKYIKFSKEERINLISHILEAQALDAIYNGVPNEDIVQNFKSELKYQMDKLGFANGEYLDVFSQKLMNRKEYMYIIYDENFETIAANGKIDGNFSQGNTGDCWLLASIKAISKSPKGIKLLNDSLKLDNEGNVFVTLKGVGKTYKITPQELKNNIDLSTGDADIRAIEIAMEKYFYEQRGVNNYLSIDSGNRMYIAFDILTGKGGFDHFFSENSYGDRIFNKDYYENPITDEVIDSFNNPNHIACVAAGGNKKDLVLDPDTNGAILTTDHAYAVIKADEKFVYLVNPHDSANEFKVPRDIFKNFFNDLNEFDL